MIQETSSRTTFQRDWMPSFSGCHHDDDDVSMKPNHKLTQTCPPLYFPLQPLSLQVPVLVCPNARVGLYPYIGNMQERIVHDPGNK